MSDIVVSLTQPESIDVTLGNVEDLSVSLSQPEIIDVTLTDTGDIIVVFSQPDDIEISLTEAQDINVVFSQPDDISVTLSQSQGEPGHGVAEGGTTGQVLVKKSSDDYDTEWVNNSGGGNSYFPSGW